MSSTSLASTIITSSPIPSAFEPPPLDDVPAHHASPVVAFIIGLGIVTLASIMNAAGLNLTKLDHVRLLPNILQPLTDVLVQVRTSAVPKAARAKDWFRPLWLLGMLLYM